MTAWEKARSPPGVLIVISFGWFGYLLPLLSMHIKFYLTFADKVQEQLELLSSKDRKQYDKAFEIFAENGPGYRSLRTHRYRSKVGEIWSSSASMAKRFYWRYEEEKTIVVTHIDSH
jgi:phage-related protein